MGFYKSFKEFQEYYANKFQRNNPLPWQDGMQAIIWWITENLPENTQATVKISGAPTGVSISGKGVDGDPYIWAFNFNRNDVKGDTGPQGPAGPQGETGPQGPAGQDGTIVVANPAESGSTDLTKLKVGDTIYNIPSGGGVYLHILNAGGCYVYFRTNFPTPITPQNATTLFGFTTNDWCVFSFAVGEIRKTSVVPYLYSFLGNNATLKWTDTMENTEWTDTVIEL